MSNGSWWFFGSDGPIRLQWFQLRVVIFLATGPWIQPRLMQRGNLHKTVLHQLLGEAMKRKRSIRRSVRSVRSTIFIPCHPSPPPQVEEAHSASWHKCSCPESRGTRGNQRNQWEWHVRHRTAPSEKPRFKPFKQASETVPKIRTWLHTAVQSGCSFIASSVELKHEETADLPLFNNTFHLNPNCWSTQHATNSTSSDAFRFAHLRQHSVGELFSDWLTESFSKHPTVSRSDQLLLDRPRPWDLSDLSAVPSSIPKYQNTKVKTDQKNFW
jgi:hypothetical protein